MHTYDSYLHDCRMFHDGGFYIKGRYIITGRNYKILDPINKENETLLVDISRIPCAKPAVRLEAFFRFRWFIPVTLCNLGTTVHDLTRLSYRKDLPCLRIHNLHFSRSGHAD